MSATNQADCGFLRMTQIGAAIKGKTINKTEKWLLKNMNTGFYYYQFYLSLRLTNNFSYYHPTGK